MAEPFVIFPGIDGNNVTTPDDPVLHVPGNFSINIDCAPITWKPGTSHIGFLSRWAGSFAITTNTTDSIQYNIVTDAGSIEGKFLNVTTDLADGSRHVIRIEFRFGVDALLLIDGIEVSSASLGAASTLVAGADQLLVGALDSSTFPFEGEMYLSELVDDTGPGIVADFNPADIVLP